MQEELIQALKTHQTTFNLALPDAAMASLAAYYELIRQHNETLNLIGPGSPGEFATRHILESLMLLAYLPRGSRFADVGTGAGLPSIPCLLVRHDLEAVLIESKEKKAKFLDLAVKSLSIEGRSRIVNRQFQEVDPSDCQAVTCRALDKFTQKLPSLLKWSQRRTRLLFGGSNLGESLQKAEVEFDQRLMPLSEKRFLFIAGWK